MNKIIHNITSCNPQKGKTSGNTLSRFHQVTDYAGRHVVVNTAIYRQDCESSKCASAEVALFIYLFNIDLYFH